MEPRPHPSKEEVRAWMARRCRTHLPPPAPDEIRRELGWHLLAPALPSVPDSAPGFAPVPVFALPFSPVSVPAFTPSPALVPVVLAELTALTAVAWYWLVLHLPNER